MTFLILLSTVVTVVCSGGYLMSKIVAGIALGLAAAAAYVWAVVEEVLPSPPEIACFIQAKFDEPASETHFAILLSKLEADPDGRQTDLIDSTLSEVAGLEVWRTCRVLKISRHGERGRARAEAETRGRQWLRDRNADLLIWGEVLAANKVLNIKFLRREGQGTVGSRPYTLNLTKLPKNFGEDLSAQLVVIILSNIRPIQKESKEYLVSKLRPVETKLQNLLETPPDYFTPLQLVGLRYYLGIVSFTIGWWDMDLSRLNEALTVFESVLQDLPSDYDPVDRAAIENNLGRILVVLGEFQGSRKKLEQAVRLFQAARNKLNRDKFLDIWFAIQNNLGNALASLGKLERDTQPLENAVDIFRTASKVISHNGRPLPWQKLQWAKTQNHLGLTLALLGELKGLEEGMEHLEKAAIVLEAALGKVSREETPLTWAAIQDSYGFVLTLLGEQKRNKALLEQAVTRLRTAHALLVEIKASLYVSVVTRNLRRAEKALKKLRN